MKMQHRTGYVLILLTTLQTVTLTDRALAQSTNNHNATLSDAEQVEARERYARGVQLANEGNYPAAQIEMQRAYSLNPSYKILYNLGQIHVHLSDYAAAQTNFERYLQEGGTDIPTSRITEVTQEITKLRPRVAIVELEVKGDGAEVLVDDTVIGRSPLRKRLLVNAGKHKFSASKAGSEPVTRVMPLAGEDKVTLQLDASNKAGAAKAQDSTEKAKTAPDGTRRPKVSKPLTEQESKNGPSYVWVGWTLTAALGVGTGISGYIATSDASDLKKLRDAPGANRQALNAQEASTFRSALVTDILLGATVIAGGISLYATLSAGPSTEKDRPQQDLALVAGPNSLLVRGSF